MYHIFYFEIMHKKTLFFLLLFSFFYSLSSDNDWIKFIASCTYQNKTTLIGKITDPTIPDLTKLKITVTADCDKNDLVFSHETGEQRVSYQTGRLRVALFDCTKAEITVTDRREIFITIPRKK